MATYLASYVDGVTAARRAVRVSLGDHGILISKAEGGYLATWGYDEIAVVPDERERGPIRLARDLARLAIEDAGFADALYAAAPLLRPVPLSRRLPRAAAAIAVSVGAVAAVWLALPFLTERAVDLIPVQMEERLGDREIAEIVDKPCLTTAGKESLDQLVDRLTAHANLPFHAKVVVDAEELVNAFALPGGRIIVLRGLLDEAQSADELAGVLAHELTHALKRHPLRHEMAEAGIGVLMEAMVGYNSTGNIGALMASFTYTRAEEAEADAGALALLKQAGISADGFADFFERLEGSAEANIPAYLSNHPTPADRLATVRAAAVKGTTPALSPAEWTALQHICINWPKTTLGRSRKSPAPKP